MKRLFVLVLLLWVLFLCLVPAIAQTGTRDHLYSALLNSKVVDPDRKLVHFSHTCDLRIDGGEYTVVDVQEVVASSTSPRGINRIVILDSQSKPVQKIEYTMHRPLFCVENRLYVYGDLSIDGVAAEGNVLTFSRQGRSVKLSHVEAHEYPLPVTRDRKSPPQ